MTTNEKKTSKADAAEFRWPFGNRNYILLGVALVVIVIGYVLLGQGSMTLAPFLLVIGYCVLVPMALILRDPSVCRQNHAADVAEE